MVMLEELPRLYKLLLLMIQSHAELKLLIFYNYLELSRMLLIEKHLLLTNSKQLLMVQGLKLLDFKIRSTELKETEMLLDSLNLMLELMTYQQNLILYMLKSMPLEIKFHQNKQELQDSKEKLQPLLNKTMVKETKLQTTDSNLLKLTTYLEILKLDFNKQEILELLFKQALLQARILLEIIKEKLMPLKQLLLILLLKLKVYKTMLII